PGDRRGDRGGGVLTGGVAGGDRAVRGVEHLLDVLLRDAAAGRGGRGAAGRGERGRQGGRPVRAPRPRRRGRAGGLGGAPAGRGPEGGCRRPSSPQRGPPPLTWRSPRWAAPVRRCRSGGAGQAVPSRLPSGASR